jgi:hypothetical protein
MTVPILLTMPGAESPAETDFTAENTLISPRKLDLLNFYQGWTGNPLWWSSYATWATALNAELFIGWSPASGSLYGGGTSDGTLGNVTTGNANTYIDAAATQLNGIAPTPVYIRLAFEMNGNWNSYGYSHETAAAFVSGWQYLVNRLRVTNGVTNAKFIWSPSIWASASVEDPTTTYPCYPGDGYVDYVALDGYATSSDASAMTPASLFLSNYAELVAMTSKPFGLGEVGCSATATGLASMGGKAGWFALLFAMIANNMPNCAFVDYYNRSDPPDDPTDDFTINSSGSDTAALAAFVLGVNSYPFTSAAASGLRLGVFC